MKILEKLGIRLSFDEQNVISEAIWKFIIVATLILGIAYLLTLIFEK